MKIVLGQSANIKKAATQASVESVVQRPVPAEAPRLQRPAGNGQVSNSQMRIITALAEAEALGRTQIARVFLATLAGVSSTSGGFRNNLGALRSGGMIDYPQNEFVALTRSGREIAPAVDPPASPQEMLDRCKANVTNAQAAILDSLFRNYPTMMDREELAVTIGVSDTSGGFRNNLGALRTAGMIDYPSQGTVKLQPWVMLEE